MLSTALNPGAAAASKASSGLNADLGAPTQHGQGIVAYPLPFIIVP